MVTINRISNDPYTVTYGHTEIRNVANDAKSIPAEWIHSSGNDIGQPLIDYLTPLIQGEAFPRYENGLPVYMNVSHLAKRP